MSSPKPHPAPLIHAVAVAVVDKHPPRPRAPLGIDQPVLVAPDGSRTSLREMLRGHLTFTRFFEKAPAQQQRYLAKLHIEGGYFTLIAGFDDDVEIFGATFLFTCEGTQQTGGPLSAEPTSRAQLTVEEGVVLDLADASPLKA